MKEKENLVEVLRKGAEKKKRCFIGFDGFTDELVVAIENRIDPEQFHPFPTIRSFGERLIESAEKSCNIELVLKQKKIGGNAPIFALGLLEGGHQIVLAATIGEKEVEPLFLPLTKRCEEVYLLGKSGHSDAIEFQDGKVILGKLESIVKLSFEQILNKIGEEKWLQHFEELDLFASVNWTMLPMMNRMWSYILEKVAPKLSPKKRFFFVDLADPKKRTDEDLRKALTLLENLGGFFEVHLGLNQAEGERIGELLSVPMNLRNPIKTLAKNLKQKLKISNIAIHSKKSASLGCEKGTFSVPTYFIESPLISTGAGDNFNAGYCNALLHGVSEVERLKSGVSTASYYVKTGKSPTLEELAIFLSS